MKGGILNASRGRGPRLQAFEVSLEGRLRPLFQELAALGISPASTVRLLIHDTDLLSSSPGSIRQAMSYLGMLGIPDHQLGAVLMACPSLVADGGASALRSLDFLQVPPPSLLISAAT